MTFSSEHDDFRRTIRRYIEEKINPASMSGNASR